MPRSRCVHWVVGLVFLTAVSLLARTSVATVTQVDGTILPQTNRMQIYLNNEGETLDAILDASQLPEVFLPNTTAPVVFKNVAEGAGFENSFGWYNVGDDIFSPAGRARNLHPIFGCGLSMADASNPAEDPRNLTDAQLTSAPHHHHHHGNPAFYVLAAEPPNTVSVDFAAERAAGRYKGGYIGFYLISPEGNPSSMNCGDYLIDSSGQSLFGKIYFSEADLNNDGDFVHNLVYTSRTTADRFYFGFEDLFRGGDNDFEDMLIQVTGLTPPCTPRLEVCNGRDDDCDGQVDGADPDLAVADCTCDGVSMPCQGGARPGECQTGKTICVAGEVLCQSTVSPTAESCNGKDDDCDGTVDDAPTTGEGVACDGSDGDSCPEGQTVCTSGVLTCSDATGDSAELCNGLDDDCDGNIDEGAAGVGIPCDGDDGDLCDEGVTACTGGTLVCTDATGTSVETCNGLDDDCDGSVDVGATDVGDPCSVGIGICQRSGATVCQSGVEVCGVSPGSPATEVCNGLDDDCDGSVDEGFAVGQGCAGIGECPNGVIECATPTTTRCSTNPGGSAYVPNPEICNSLDDDCDGSVDEGLTDLGPCGSDEGECSAGVKRCLAGAEVCQGAVGPTPEVCNGKDDDCDGLLDERTGDPGDTNGGLVDEGASCGSDVGECRAGRTVCVSGVAECQGRYDGGPEVCNGLDDDCDGVADDAPIDVGQACGATDLGECEFGLTVCVNGTVRCSGEVGPTIEICNGKDDDCDGVIDDDPLRVGAPCGGSPVGVCTPGRYACVAGSLVCEGAQGGTSEVCNGLDDDCDGVVDDSPLDVGAACGETTGECEPGTMQCISGTLQCVGGVTPTTERCNNLDDDCDGNVDEDDPCAEGVCVDGECAAPCVAGEFPCPPGKRCENGVCLRDPCYGVACSPGPDGAKTICVEGACVPVCETLTCGPGTVCRATDGLCVPDNCLYVEGKCSPEEYCRNGECVVNPCHGVSCAAGEFCRGGDCVKSCGGVTCPDGQECHDGVCAPTGCDRACGRGEICHRELGRCVTNPCLTPCPIGEACDPQTGNCVSDPCAGIDCPGDEVCWFGDCYTRGRTPVDPATPGDRTEYITAAGGGGCDVGARRGRAAEGSAAVLFALATLVLIRRSRTTAAAPLLSRRLSWPGSLAAALLLGTSCQVDPYALTGDGGRGDGGTAGDAPPVDAAPDAPVNCIPGAPEVCNGFDDDCDGDIDERIDFGSDEQNCGVCGKVCEKTGARTECRGGFCVAYECFPGNVDLNGDLAADFDSSNGCEYACFVSNGGMEACDGLDNDCDGQIDEDTDFLGDEANCGACGKTCTFYKARATCVAGTCRFAPPTDCEAGFHDVNGIAEDGCEYACSPSGTEVCDYLDNDCDGQFDEGFDLTSDPLHCGDCGRACLFPQVATPRCAGGLCGFDPMTDCLPGWVDVNGNQLDGCEYACVPTTPPTEVCDGLDNDCDGVVDGATVDSGASCHNAPGPTPEGECTETGTIRCVGAALVCEGAPKPRSETCNGKDDDCDGEVDEEPVDVGAVCAPPIGACTVGLWVCNAGVRECVREVGPAPEVCNGLDDDCNGTVDDNPTDPGLGSPCGTDQGECQMGVLECQEGTLVCAGSVGPRAETCNGRDDDCDGTTDNSPIDAFGPCGSGVGACVPGTLVCQSGVLVCSGAQGPTSETCNNRDDDCDGTSDEDLQIACYEGPAGTEGVGICRGGIRTCSSGSFGSCVGQVLPATETCNDVDDDCNGLRDDNVTRGCYTGPAGTLGVGRCRAGTETCSGGIWSGVCAGEVTPSAEVCDGQDDDCDGQVDEDGTGAPLSQSCYSGPAGTAGQGTCMAGTQTCQFGGYGLCVGEVTPTVDRCGDGLDTDCDGVNDFGEGCLGLVGYEVRLDASMSTRAQFHSWDVTAASAGNRAYVAWSDKSDGSTRADVWFRRSTDGGASWANAVDLTTHTTDPCVAPQIVATGSYVYVVYLRVDPATDQRRVAFKRSADGGQNFSGEILLSSGGSADSFHADLATSADGSLVVVVWEQLDTGNLNRTIVSRASSNFGASFQAARTVNVNSTTPIVAGRPQVAITGANRLVFVWREARGTSTYDVYATWTNSVSGAIAAANEQRLDGDGGDARQSDLPQLVAVADQVYAVWQDLAKTPGGGSDVMFVRSTDGGASWSGERILDDPAAEESASFTPVLAVDAKTAAATDDVVYVAWQDSREGSQIYAARSADAGATFGSPVRASNQNGSPVTGVSREPQIAFVGSDTVVVAYSNDASGRFGIYAAVSIDAGTTWLVSDLRLDGGGGPALSPVVVPASGGGLTLGALVAWDDFRPTTGTQPVVNGDPWARRIGR